MKNLASNLLIVLNILFIYLVDVMEFLITSLVPKILMCHSFHLTLHRLVMENQGSPCYLSIVNLPCLLKSLLSLDRCFFSETFGTFGIF